jgi:hypothetical protein
MSSNHTKPILSLKTFSSKLIDYAGLFPPASLNMAQAFHNYVFYMQGEYKWMLNKFIIPSKRLGELAEIMEGMKVEGKVPFSVLGTGGETVNEFNKSFANDIKAITDFKTKHGNTVSIDSFEVRLPKEIFEQDNNDELLDLMIGVSAELENILGKNIPVFYEAVMTDDYEQIIIRTVETIASLDKGCGFKMRTGGVEASAFPKAEQIAFAIMTCCEFDVQMKCTAGLHHPIRHYSEQVSSYMHGFLNVFGAGILAYTNNLDEAELIEVLNDEDPYEFVFSENGIHWKDEEVPNAQIKKARESFIISYGSCSFDEPIDDLKTMELL